MSQLISKLKPIFLNYFALNYFAGGLYTEVSGQHDTCDHVAHDLTGTGADGSLPRVQPQARHVTAHVSRPAHDLDSAIKEITSNKGSLYDPKVVDAAVKVVNQRGYPFTS